jgi:hypothetical protein
VRCCCHNKRFDNFVITNLQYISVWLFEKPLSHFCDPSHGVAVQCTGTRSPQQRIERTSLHIYQLVASSRIHKCQLVLERHTSTGLGNSDQMARGCITKPNCLVPGKNHYWLEIAHTIDMPSSFCHFVRCISKHNSKTNTMHNPNKPETLRVLLQLPVHQTRTRFVPLLSYTIGTAKRIDTVPSK